ncbi:MAG: hypothetical protein H6741_24075 [Alphaproteobacteria bacterium]|nr:hypothetical protein [Alphaproteobacteria bacterium]MCB9795785.1 hypothetical protein [Alphaproteobacteria bacterium]
MLLLLALSTPAAAQEQDYAQGYRAGRTQAAEAPLLRAGAVSFGMGFLCAGVGCASVGVLGAPAILAGAAGPPLAYNLQPLSPPPGDWQQASRPYQLGYIEGYDQHTRRRKTAVSAGAAVLGAGLGTAAGVTTVLVVGARLGYGPF